MRWRYAVAAFETTRASRRPWDVDVRPAIQKGPHRCGPSLVELPGIEPATQIALRRTNVAGRRESTRNDARRPANWRNVFDGINTFM